MKLVSFTASGRSSYGVVAGDLISTGTPEGVGFARKPPLLTLAEAARAHELLESRQVIGKLLLKP